MSASTPDIRGWHGPLVVHVTFEAALGLLAAFFIGFFAPVIFGLLGLIAMAQGRFGLMATSMPLMLLTGWIALLTARMAAEASIGRLHNLHEPPPRINPSLPAIHLPFALAMAARLPQLSWFWRPWLGVWWIAHFCIAAGIGHNVAVHLIRRFDVATLVIAVPLAAMIHFAFLFASNLYLILAARTLAPTPRLCCRVWKYRFLIDCAVATLLLIRGIR